MIILYKIDTDIVFYKMNLDFTSLRSDLETGSKIGYDLYGNQLSAYDAIKTLNGMSNHKLGSTIDENIKSNIELAPLMISIVRFDMISTSLSALGLNATGMLQKLSGVISATQVGMFKEAAQMLQYSITPDAFLTTQRLGLYASLLYSADALAQCGYN